MSAPKTRRGAGGRPLGKAEKQRRNSSATPAAERAAILAEIARLYRDRDITSCRLFAAEATLRRKLAAIEAAP
jgi:acyl-CoA reductase-like NAD-dependent aldehyde dehydrogenase